MYKVKTFDHITGEGLQIELSRWVRSREYITLVSVNVWFDSPLNKHYGIIIYRENHYEL